MLYNSIVRTNIPYNYNVLIEDIQQLKKSFSFLEIGTIGNSVLGNPIPYIRIGTGKKEVFYSASYHANEWITTPVLMKFVEDFSYSVVNKKNIYGYNANYLYGTTSIFIVPMVNPDGVNIVTNYYSKNSKPYLTAKSILENFPGIPFPNGWKANITGIDLNLQFPANWEKAKEIKFAQGYNQPSPRDYVGTSPLSAPEAIAIYNFTLIHNFRLILAYHTQGEIIYWRYLNYLPPASYFIGEKFANISGYSLEETPYISSFAGYKDWFIQNYDLPGYTIECGLGESPLPISQFNSIYDKNLGILVLGTIF